MPSSQKISFAVLTMDEAKPMRLLMGPSEAKTAKLSAAPMLAIMVLNQAARLRWLRALRQTDKFFAHSNATGSTMLG